MAPIENKRVRCEVDRKSRKRQKQESGNRRSIRTSATQSASLDALPWQEVVFPENGFDNAEGFFGLEELSDVDIIRDPTIGKVEFRVCQLFPNSIWHTNIDPHSFVLKI